MHYTLYILCIPKGILPKEQKQSDKMGSADTQSRDRKAILGYFPDGKCKNSVGLYRRSMTLGVCLKRPIMR